MKLQPAQMENRSQSMNSSIGNVRPDDLDRTKDEPKVEDDAYVSKSRPTLSSNKSRPGTHGTTI